MEQAEKIKFIRALVISVLLVIVIVVAKLAEIITGGDFYEWGVYPHTLYGLRGILFAPLVHADFNHLYNNCIPLFVLSLAVFNFYGRLGYQVLLLSWVLPGLWVWIGARHSFHIGASGLVYSLAAFLFLSGLVRRHIPLIAISLIVVFMYGSMVWYIFPIDYEISWESHLFGSIAGFILALVYRTDGPQRHRYSWEDDDEDTDMGIDASPQTDESPAEKDEKASY